MVNDIIRINYAKTALPESMIFSGGSDEKRIPIVFSCFLLLTENKKILVDAGCDTMSDFFVMRDFIGTVQALKNINISPEEITDILITHSHHDHIECVKYFKNAVVHIQQDEYESGKSYLTENLNVDTFKDECVVCDNIKLVKIGGHSKGSCIVEIDDYDTTYIISGDECYVRECLQNNIPTGSSVDLEKSKYFIEKYSSKEYTVLLSHEEII